MVLRSASLFALVFALTCSATATVSMAQNTGEVLGTIKGTVADPQGAVISSADIKATNLETGHEFTSRSNGNGFFILTGLAYGQYSIEAVAPGFKKSFVKVSLSKDSPTSPHNPQLHVDLGEVMIEIRLGIGGSEVLACVVCSYVYFSIPYADLPLRDRDPQRLLKLQPGVTEHKNEFSLAGLRVTSKNGLLNSIDNRDAATGRFVVSLGLDSVDEFGTGSAGAPTSLDADYSQSSSNQVSAQSRSGFNNTHARAFWFLERPALTANNFFTNRGALQPDETRYDQAGGTFGGPLSVPGLFSGRDHAFFFASYERTRQHQVTGRQTIAPLSSFVARSQSMQGPLFRSLFAQGRVHTTDGRLGELQDVDGDGMADLGDAAFRSSSQLVRNLAMARLDFVLTDAHRLSATYADDQFNNTDAATEFTFTSSSPMRTSHRGRLLGVQFTALSSPQTASEFRFGYRHGETAISGSGSDAPQLVAVNNPLGIGSGLPELPDDRASRALTLAGTLSSIQGTHAFKVGGQVSRRNEFQMNSGLLNGRIYYSDLIALITDGVKTVGGQSRAIVRAEIANEPESERYRFTDFYGFASDNWRANPRFVMNFGVAYNLYSGVLYDQRSDRNNLAPFASFALGITRSEAFILRGGASISYAPPTISPYGELKATPLYPVATGFTRREELAAYPLPRDWSEKHGAVEIEPHFSPNLRTAYSESAFIGLQHSIRQRLIIEAVYDSTRGRRLTRAHSPGRSVADGAGPGNESDSSEEELLISSDGNSSYHSLQLRATSRERRGLVFQAHYTLSKAIDTASDDRFNMFRSLTFGPVFRGDPALERALADFDRRHRGVGFFHWQLPSVERVSRFARALLGDWRVSGVVVLQSGPHVSVYSSGDYFGGRGDFNRDGVLNDRLAYVGMGSFKRAISATASPADGYFNTSLFVAPGEDGHQALGRNVLPAPGYASVDLSLQRVIPLGDSRLELRAEAFNVTNRVNFLPPETDSVRADFGRSHKAGPSRSIRLAIRYSF